nr:immunoglobulin light chain junction region [Macaca mulatta]MOV77321.1 immunoglobulin light chain junction region [Macaca mulatta]MOW09863.1 immunoglobulin light chain junction region [Macaca mulatta]MOW09979.1 immunoglobulin light chain junction region [Macaca mulatta]MOW10625.1 immunoglobulin light chain junction region [Macaca mulatta]
CMQGMQLPLTF